MAQALAKNELHEIHALAASTNDQLSRLYRTLGMIVTAAGTLNGELSELPTPQHIQEVAAELERLRVGLRPLVGSESNIPDRRRLNEAAEAASTLAAELARVKEIWDQLPGAAEIEAKIEFLTQLRR